MITSCFRNFVLRQSLPTILFSAILASTAGAANIDLSKLPPPSDRKDVTFQKDIKPLFKTSCVQCHSGDRPRGGLQLDTLEHVLKGSKDGKVIKPGDSEKSKLVIAVAQLDPHSAMPPKPRHHTGGPGAPASQGGPNPGGPGSDASQHASPNPSTNTAAGGPPKPMMPMPKPLTATEVGLVRAWIDQGAK